MIHGDPETDLFFEKNPEHRYVPEVKELIDLVGIEKAGRLMWAVYIIHHPRSSIFEMSLDDKELWVMQNFLSEESKDFDWDILDDVVDVFPRISMTQEQRMYYDAVNLYEIAVREAKVLDAKDKSMFIRGIGTTAKEITKLKQAYIESDEKDERSSGEMQSGWAARQRNRPRIGRVKTYKKESDSLDVGTEAQD